MSQAVPLEASHSGLTAAEVAERLARGEVNRVRRSNAAAYLDIAARNLFTLFNALVVPAAIALYSRGETRDALAICGMALTNLVLGLIQEIRAKIHLDHLTLLAETRVRAVRDGRIELIPAGDVVRGDLLLLAAGDSVAADGRVVESRFLEVDEALLTGESDPVPRRPGDELLSGSFCAAGEGSYRAERVGAASFAQRTAQEARTYRYRASPIQISINRLIAILTGTAVALCLGYAVLYVVRGLRAEDVWKMVAATITSMVPQGLVLMATLAFVLGAVRMSRRGALVHRLNAVEAMAAIDTLCMDKTGTLTTNRLFLERLVLLDDSLPEEAIRARLRLFASASLDRASKSLTALRTALGEAPAELLDQLPFKSQNRYSAVRVRSENAEYTLVLGACEALRPFLRESGRWEAAWRDLLPTGLRLLLFAEAEGAASRPFGGALAGVSLRPLALAALRDELRPEARGVLEELAAQGIQFKILSGDNADTVRAVAAPLAADTHAAAVKALAEMPVVSGTELQASGDPAELARTRCVFGRLSPSQKVEIIAALKKAGYRVAMIGDGVNDVLPIKTADLGIAMGDGAAASKTVSGIVLETNDFALLPATLQEGRVILRNLRRAGKLFLTKNVFSVVLIVGALGVLGLPFPYVPRQVTLLNFLTIGIPAFLLMLSRERAAAVSAAHFLREVGSFILRTGIVIGAAGLLLFWLAHRLGYEDDRIPRTMLLSLLVLLDLLTLLRALGDGETRPAAGDARFRWLAAASLLVYLAVMYVRPVGDWFALAPLTLAAWGWILAIAAASWAALGLTDRWVAGRISIAPAKWRSDAPASRG